MFSEEPLFVNQHMLPHFAPVEYIDAQHLVTITLNIRQRVDGNGRQICQRILGGFGVRDPKLAFKKMWCPQRNKRIGIAIVPAVNHVPNRISGSFGVFCICRDNAGCVANGQRR
jgi:hypothetical protein